MPGNDFDATLDAIHQEIVSPFPLYQITGTKEQRQKALVDIAHRISGAATYEWWIKVQQRIAMVLLSKWLRQEATLFAFG